MRPCTSKRPQPQLAARDPAARELPRGGKIKKRTLLNLSDWPRERRRGLARRCSRAAWSCRRAIRTPSPSCRSLPHGHVAAVLGTARKIGLDRMLGAAGNRCRDLVLAMIVSRIIAPASKLATARRR